MLVPVVFALHYAKAHHGVVYLAKRLIVPLVRNCFGQRRHVDELERIKFDVEVCSVGVGCIPHEVGSFVTVGLAGVGAFVFA